MLKVNQSYHEPLLTDGEIYDVGMNDGVTFKSVKFLGTKQYHGKAMMCFETTSKKSITINPSYNSFIIEKGENNNG
tara:strand:- start:577 stop:804 length:228 start_codon:yes stop_codon:yes gene_type:complete